MNRTPGGAAVHGTTLIMSLVSQFQGSAFLNNTIGITQREAPVCLRHLRLVNNYRKIITARRYAGAEYAAVVYPSVCRSHAGIVPKRLTHTTPLDSHCQITFKRDMVKVTLPVFNFDVRSHIPGITEARVA